MAINKLKQEMAKNFFINNLNTYVG